MARAGWKRWRGPAAVVAAQTGSREAVRDAAHVILEAAGQEVPHDEGTLERSGQVIMAPGQEPAACISFGFGPGTGHPVVPYAIRWHEKQARFQKGRKYRYLVDPLNRVGPGALRDALKRHVGRRLT